MSDTYEDWLGRRVVLQIEDGESLVPLRGRVVSESSAALRFRIDERWDVDIFKEMIALVQPDDGVALGLNNFRPNRVAPDTTASLRIPAHNWNRFVNHWLSRTLSVPLSWKSVLSAGLAGSILFVLALEISAQGTGSHFARFFLGYWGVLFCAASLGCGMARLLNSTGTRSQFISRWLKLVASVLRWLRHPIHL